MSVLKTILYGSIFLMYYFIFSVYAFPSAGDIVVSTDVDPVRVIRVECIPYYSVKNPIPLTIIINNIPDINKFDLDSFNVKTSVDGFSSSLDCSLDDQGSYSLRYLCTLPPFEIQGVVGDTYVLGVKVSFDYGPTSQTSTYTFDKQLTLNIQKEQPQPLSLAFQSAEILNNLVEAKAYHSSCTQISDDDKPLTFYMYFSSNFLNLDYFTLENVMIKIDDSNIIDVTSSLTCQKSITSNNLINVSCVINNFHIDSVITCASYDLAVNDEVDLSLEAQISYKMGDNDAQTSSFQVPLRVRITSLLSEQEIREHVEAHVSYTVDLDTSNLQVSTIEGTGYYTIQGVRVYLSINGVDLARVSDVTLNTNIHDQPIHCNYDGSRYACLLPPLSGIYGSLPFDINLNLMFSYVYDGITFETQHNKVLSINDAINVQSEDFTIYDILYELEGEDLEGTFYNDAGKAYLLELRDGGLAPLRVSLKVSSNYPGLTGSDLSFNNFEFVFSCDNGRDVTIDLDAQCAYTGKEQEYAVFECSFAGMQANPFVECYGHEVTQGDTLNYAGVLRFDVLYKGEVYGQDYATDTFNGNIDVVSVASSLEDYLNVEFNVVDNTIECEQVEGSSYCKLIPQDHVIEITLGGISPTTDFSQYSASFVLNENEQYDLNCELIDHQDLYAKLACGFEQGQIIQLLSGSLSGDVGITVNVDGTNYYYSQPNIVFNINAQQVDLSYVVTELNASITPADEEGNVVCDVNQNYECDFSSHILSLEGKVETNAPDLLPGVFALKVAVDTGQDLKEYAVGGCEFNDNLEFSCAISLSDLGMVPYVSTLGVYAYYASGDHVDEQIKSFTFSLIIPQELIDFYSNVSFNVEVVFLDNAIYKRIDESSADLPVCIIPVSVGKYWQEYNQQQGTMPSQQIWESLRSNYGYGNVNYDQPLCSFAGESIGLIVKVPELYHVDDFELSYVGYSLGNARDFYSATCVPLSSNDEYVDRYKRGETGMTFYCMLPNLEFLMDDFAGVMPEIEAEANVPLYIKLKIRDGKWDREGEYATNFKFLMENSYGALTQKLNSLEEERDQIQNQIDKINKISKRAGTAAAAVAALDAAFGARATNKPIIRMLSIAGYAGCPMGCAIYASTCSPHHYASCYSTCKNDAKKHSGLGHVHGFCWGLIDYAFVCTTGGALLLSGSMVNTLEKMEQDYQEITDEIYDVESRLQEGQSYTTIRQELDDRFDPYAEGSYHRSFLMELSPSVTKIGGAIFSAACSFGFFDGFTGMAKEITMQSLATQFAANAITSGINAWVYGEKLSTAVAGAAASTVISVGTSHLATTALGKGLGGSLLNLFRKGSVIVGIFMAGINKPEGMSTMDAMLYYWGAWSFSEGTAALGEFIVDFGSAYWERYKIKSIMEDLPPNLKNALREGNIKDVRDYLESKGISDVKVVDMVVGTDSQGKDVTEKVLVVRRAGSSREFTLRIDDQGVHVGGYRIVSNERITNPMEFLKEDYLEKDYSGQGGGIVRIEDLSLTNENPSQPNSPTPNNPTQWGDASYRKTLPTASNEMSA